MASETLDASQHNQGPFLDLFPTPMMGNLTFQEVVNRVLYENRCQAQCSLDDLRARRARIREELDDLTKAHREESDKSSRKRIKKEIDMRCKEILQMFFTDKGIIIQFKNHKVANTIFYIMPVEDYGLLFLLMFLSSTCIINWKKSI